MGIGDLGGFLNSYPHGGLVGGYPLQSSAWTSIATSDTATANTITVYGWGSKHVREPEKPVSPSVAWLDQRVGHVTMMGRELLEAA